MIHPDIDLTADLSLPRIQPVGICSHRDAQLTFARLLRNTLGVRVAADYLHRLGWSIEGALFVLVGANAVERVR